MDNELKELEVFSVPEPVKVRDIASFKAEYQSLYRLIYKYIENLPPDVTIEERQILLLQEINKLKTKFIDDRSSEYNSKSITLSRKLKLVKDYSGPPKKRKTGYLDGGHPGLYTNNVKLISGSKKRIGVEEGGARSFIYLSRSSKGTSRGAIQSTFYWRPSYINLEVNEDWDELYFLITDYKEFDLDKAIDSLENESE